METPPPDLTPPFRRFLARCVYAWGIALVYRGNRFSSRPLYERSVAAFRKAIELWPAFAQAHYRSGLIKGRELGFYRAAIIDLDRATRFDPEWPEPYLQRGLFHRFHHQPADALHELRQFLAFDHQSTWRDEAERQVTMLLLEHPELQASLGARETDRTP